MDSGVDRHQPLYLKCRPQSLDKLVGQEAVTRTLNNAIAHNRISHAYLFTGPRGTGKTSTARILAKSLNCESGPTASPCQTCTQCIEIANCISPAVFEIDAASNNSVDDARSLIERAPLVAVGGRFKLYIIDECHMLTKEAFNALLKTIEEPPPQVVFVLATTEEHKVPPTIISRCQRLMFRLVSQDTLADYLRQIAEQERILIDDEAISLIARRSGGGLRDALGLLDQAGLLSAPDKAVSVNDLLALLGSVAEDVLLEMSEQILNRNGQALLAQVNQLLMEGREPSMLAMELARHFLNLTKASYLVESKAKSSDAVNTLITGSSKYVGDLCNQAPHFERSELAQIVEQLDRLEQTLRRTTQPGMTLEMGLLALCHRHDLLMIKELSERVRQLEAMLSSTPQANSLPSQPRKMASKSESHPSVSQQPAASHDKPQRQSELGEHETKAQSVNQLDSQPETSDETQAQHPSADKGIHQVASAGDESDGNLPESVGLAPGGDAVLSTVNRPDHPELESAVESEDEEDLDEFWSRLIEVLENRHRPTWSLVSTHAFPVALSSKDLTLGVHRENFQKMIEGKSQHIKAACEEILGRDLAVRVKVLAQAPVRAQARPRAIKEQSAVSVQSDAEDLPDGALAYDSSTPPASIVTSPADVSITEQPAEKQVLSGAPKATAVADSTGLVKEAYKLFDGPGSRQIG